MFHSRARGLWLAAFAVLALQGCQGLYLHQPDRAALAATAKKQLDSVDIDAVTATEQANVALMTTAEIKAVDAREKSVAQLAAVDLSTSENSIGSHYTDAMDKVETVFGTDDMVALKAGLNCVGRRDAALGRLLVLGRRFPQYGIEKPPACAVPMPSTLAAPAALSDDARKKLGDLYAQYSGQCNALTNRACDVFDRGGELVKAEDKARQGKVEIEAAAAAVKTARDEYAAAVNDNKGLTDKASKTEEELRQKAQKVLDALKKLSDLSPSEAGAIKSLALVELLSAAASGTPEDGEPRAAVVIAGAIPAIAQSIAQARAAGAQVPVSHLLLALNREVILSERAGRLAALDAENLEVVRQKVKARQKQAALWMQYSDSLCKLAITADGKDEISGECTIVSYPSAKNDAPACVLKVVPADPKIAAPPPLKIANCALSKSWRTLFKQTPGKPVARRYLHEAAAAYLTLRLNAYDTVQEELRRIDVLYRRTIVEREAALEQWKNLIAVPTTELDAYYAGGAKPAEIADLLIKALGLTAIAVGAAK
jgi:hypothetical protein